VSESARRLIHATDEVSTSLGLLEILPREEMSALLEAELIRGGFHKDGDTLRRDADGATVVVDPVNGNVTVRSETKDDVSLRSRKEALAFEDIGPTERSVRKELHKRAKADLSEQVAEQQAKLQQQATEKLEQHLRDLTPELNRAVNRVTAEALKKKAAQIGRIKDIHDDVEGGSLTITVEV
jgi:FtsH ternary system domain X5